MFVDAPDGQGLAENSIPRLHNDPYRAFDAIRTRSGPDTPLHRSGERRRSTQGAAAWTRCTRTPARSRSRSDGVRSYDLSPRALERIREDAAVVEGDSGGRAAVDLSDERRAAERSLVLDAVDDEGVGGEHFRLPFKG
jgi:hypothetical protein